ncbi:HlyD family type I secretion periplasmic adaptor subunit [Synechococcus sp. RSCCF101]|nr:HlyD family type I secretion periplasmic adaptor subunit [Synechococcus sp. RSCCF101]
MCLTTHACDDRLFPSSSSPKSDSLALPISEGVLSKLPGIDNRDTIALVGRQRLSQALELEEQTDNRFLRYSVYAAGAALLIFLPWAALTPITQVAYASGEVIPEGEVSVVQHLEGGIVDEVLVQDGETVVEGQELLLLRPNLLETEYRAMQQKLANLTLQQRQLQAAIDGETAFEAGDDDPVAQAQLELLAVRQQNRRDRISSLEAQIAQKEAEIRGIDDQIRQFRYEQQLYRQEKGMYKDLVDQGAASELNLLDAEQNVASSLTKMAELQGTRAEAVKLLQEARAELQGLKSGLQFEQTSEKAALINEQEVLADDINRVEIQLERTRIKAPVTGVINDLRFPNPDSVVAPGATVLQVVPNDTTKVVQARVRATDIGFIYEGQPVEVKVEPYDSNIYGTVWGTVESISPSTVQDPDTRAYFYTTQIALNCQAVSRDNSKTSCGEKGALPIQVGMPVVADFQGPKRSVLRYLFQPFTRTLDSAFREQR